jgi:hypothetical protein
MFADWQTCPNTLQVKTCFARLHLSLWLPSLEAASGHCFNMSSVQAHRLVLLADKEGKASEAEDLLFEAIYENGKNVSDIATLEQIRERLQLPGVRLLPSLPLICPFILQEGHGIAAIKV